MNFDMKKIGLISLVCWFFSPFCLMAQGVNETKDSVNVEKVDIFTVLMKCKSYIWKYINRGDYSKDYYVN